MKEFYELYIVLIKDETVGPAVPQTNKCVWWYGEPCSRLSIDHWYFANNVTFNYILVYFSYAILIQHNPSDTIMIGITNGVLVVIIDTLY